MKKFMVKSRGGNIDIPVYVSELTNLMQMRVQTKEREYTLFECGVDYHHGVWLSNVGVWGTTLKGLVENYLQYAYTGYMTQIKFIWICDDGEMNETQKVDGKIAYCDTDIFEVESFE